MRIHVAPETFRRLAAAGAEHQLDVDLQATTAIAAAVAAWRGGVRSTVPAADELPDEDLQATITGGAVVAVNLRARVEADVRSLAARRRVAPEIQIALILWASVRHFDPPPVIGRAAYVPRRWRVRTDVDFTQPLPSAPASITAAVMGDPSHRVSIGAERAGIGRGEGWEM